MPLGVGPNRVINGAPTENHAGFCAVSQQKSDLNRAAVESWSYRFAHPVPTAQTSPPALICRTITSKGRCGGPCRTEPLRGS
jgi:hypothetical protein